MKKQISSVFALLALMTPTAFAAEVPVTTSDFAAAYAAAADGDVLVMAAGKYAPTVSFPSGKTITLRAAEGAEVWFTSQISLNHTAAGGLCLDGVNVDRGGGSNYFITGDATADITELSFKNLEITGVGRCFLRSNSAGGQIRSVSFDNCLIHDCGTGGWNFIYSKHLVQKISVTNSTLYNYQTGESFFCANAAGADNVFDFTFEHNTVYKWGKDNSRAICNVGSNYNAASVFTFRNNIFNEPGGATLPNILKATGGNLVADHNLVVNYGGYNHSSAVSSSISDLTLTDLSLSGIGFPDPDHGDFTIVSSSPLATASTTGGCLGDGRWLKVVEQAVVLTTTVQPEGAGSSAPARATYEAGSPVTVTASAHYGYRFNSWQTVSGVVVSTENPFSFTIGSDSALVAVFDVLDTYVLTVHTDGAGGNWGKVTLSPEPTDGCYESGTQVVVTAHNTIVSNFQQWEDGSTVSERTITIDADKTISATYDKIPFIVAWDFDPSEPRGNRPADYAAATDNAGLMTFHNGDGSQTNWGGSTKTFGGETLTCARRYTDYDKMSAPRYFKAAFSTIGYEDIEVSSLVAIENNCVHSVQKLQISTDDVNYTDLCTLTFSKISSSWSLMGGLLAAEYENQPSVYLRWQGDPTSDLVGTCSTKDTEGFFLANVVIKAEDAAGHDPNAPVLISSTPAQGSVGASASGRIILSFDERVVAGSGDCIFDGKPIVPAFGSATAIFTYSNLDYNTTYTLEVPAGAIVDRAGNAFAGVSLQFSTMSRPTPDAALFDAVVAQDGTGQYTLVQDAVAAAPTGRVKPWIIFVKNGSYEETVVIPADKPYIHLIGQDKMKTLIHYKLNSQGQPTDPPAYANDTAAWPYSVNNPDCPKYKQSGGSVVNVLAANFYTENISYVNDWGVTAQNGPMALAMNSNADRLTFYNCRFRSYQDTWQTTNQTGNRHYVKDCYVEGAVDYIYGSGDCYFDRCTMYNVRSGSVIIAPAHREGEKFGYVFDHCTVDGNAKSNDGKAKFGRPWHNAPQAVFLYTTLNIAIAPEGWTDMGTCPKIFADYGSTDAHGNPVDTRNRKTVYKWDNGASSGTAKASLTPEEAAAYTYEAVTEGTDHWNPRALMEAVAQPQNLQIVDARLTWDAVAYARCYVIMRGATVVGFSTTTSYGLSGAEMGETFSVIAVNEYGSLGRESEAVSVTTGISALPGGAAASSGVAASASVYDLQGRRLKAANRQGFSISNGMKYLLK